ncbi:MAG: putative Dihydrofolate reductase type 3 [Candidatus Saccharibacteria bacterium]|nr:putative Dihydrofolate reductase type 3 [Candidatus Saccharibacteria bacterium]
MKCIVVAYDNSRVIGGNNTIPWQGHMPADMRHFKELTMGKTVIMGRKTLESIGRPLPYRQNIVLTHQDIEYEGVAVVHSLAHAYAKAEADIAIIGGAEVYGMALEDADVIYATEIDTVSQGDVRFPKLPIAWVETSREHHSADSDNKYDYSFVTYKKQK